MTAPLGKQQWAGMQKGEKKDPKACLFCLTCLSGLASARIDEALMAKFLTPRRISTKAVSGLGYTQAMESRPHFVYTCIHQSMHTSNKGVNANEEKVVGKGR